MTDLWFCFVREWSLIFDFRRSKSEKKVRRLVRRGKSAEGTGGGDDDDDDEDDDDDDNNNDDDDDDDDDSAQSHRRRKRRPRFITPHPALVWAITPRPCRLCHHSYRDLPEACEARHCHLQKL